MIATPCFALVGSQKRMTPLLYSNGFVGLELSHGPSSSAFERDDSHMIRRWRLETICPELSQIFAISPAIRQQLGPDSVVQLSEIMARPITKNQEIFSLDLFPMRL